MLWKYPCNYCMDNQLNRNIPTFNFCDWQKSDKRTKFLLLHSHRADSPGDTIILRICAGVHSSKKERYSSALIGQWKIISPFLSMHRVKPNNLLGSPLTLRRCVRWWCWHSVNTTLQYEMSSLIVIIIVFSISNEGSRIRLNVTAGKWSIIIANAV